MSLRDPSVSRLERLNNRFHSTNVRDDLHRKHLPIPDTILTEHRRLLCRRYFHPSCFIPNKDRCIAKPRHVVVEEKQ